MTRASIGTLVPTDRTTLPLTVMRPALISPSACLRAQTPALLMNLFSRMSVDEYSWDEESDSSSVASDEVRDEYLALSSGLTNSVKVITIVHNYKE